MRSVVLLWLVDGRLSGLPDYGSPRALVRVVNRPTMSYGGVRLKVKSFVPGSDKGLASKHLDQH